MSGDLENTARIELGYDHDGKQLPNPGSIEAVIKAFDPELSQLGISSNATRIFEALRGQPTSVAHAVLYEVIPNHFNNANERFIKSLERDYRDYLKKSPTGDHNINLDIIPLLDESTNSRDLNPAQDYFDEKMYYAINIGGSTYLINTDREYSPIENVEDKGCRLSSKSVDTCRFSSKGIKSFLKDTKMEVSETFEKVRNYITRFVYLKEDSLPTFLSIWCMGTYIFRVFQHYPYIWLNAEKQSGKSLLLKVMSKIAFNGEIILNPSPATIFRDVANNSPSLFLDEMEKLQKYDKEMGNALFSLLNSGFEKGGYVKRNEKSSKGEFFLKKFDVYCPKVIAGINSIDDVLQDRTIKIKILRKKENEIVERYKESVDILELQRQIRDELYQFGLLYGPEIARMYNCDKVSGMNHLSNRELDIWEPIFAIANFIDSESNCDSLTSQMISLSKESSREKQEESLASNDTYRLLKNLKDMTKNLKPAISEDENLYYDQGEVMEFFRNTEDFAWLKDKQVHSLTRWLKKVNINSVEKRKGSTKSRYYCIRPLELDDLLERYLDATE